MNNSQIGFATFKREEDKHNGLLASMHGVFFVAHGVSPHNNGLPLELQFCLRLYFSRRSRKKSLLANLHAFEAVNWRIVGSTTNQGGSERAGIHIRQP